MIPRRGMGLQRRIILTALAAAGSALLAMHLLTGPGLRQRALDRERDALLAEARLAGHVVDDALLRGESSGVLDALVDEAARDVRSRLTIIALDGRVLADSGVSTAGLATVENHGRRPEVLQALESGTGTATRRSTTVAEELMYAAVAVRHEGRLLAVARAAHSLRGIEQQIGDLRRSVLWSLLLAFGITAVLSAVLARPVTGPVRDIMDAARRLAAGDLTARIRVARQDELGELAAILNRAADQLQERLNELARDRARTNAILEAMEEGVLAVNHAGKVLLANDVLVRALGLENPLDRHYLEVVRHHEIGELVEGVLSTGERQVREVELSHLQRVFAVTAVRFPGAEGAAHGAVLSFHDATERRRLDRLRRDFVANASHELRTPLTSIRGFVEALEDGALDDANLAKRFLGKIHTHAERMVALADDLLELSRLESDARPPVRGSCDPAAVVEEVVGEFAEQAALKRIRLEAHAPRGSQVIVDEERLRRILENLVDNAVKYTSEDGQVQVVLAPQPDGKTLIEVIDDGPGIAAEHLPRLFERFYRVDKARSRDLGGTGLGLAIVKHLAEAMGAQVSVASTVGEGSRFRLWLPVSAERST